MARDGLERTGRYDGTVPYASQLYPPTRTDLPNNEPRNREQRILPVSHTGVQASNEAQDLVTAELRAIEELKPYLRPPQ